MVNDGLQQGPEQTIRQTSLREAPPKKKRENVGILKKQGGGSTRIPLPFFTVFNMGDPP